MTVEQFWKAEEIIRKKAKAIADLQDLIHKNSHDKVFVDELTKVLNSLVQSMKDELNNL